MKRAESGLAAWSVVLLLHAAYALAFVDRLVIGLLAPSIRASLHLSDVRMGLLMGPAFAICYILAGLGLGALVDRGRRVWIVAGAIFAWSLATMVCGLAGGFSSLFVARVFVGIGEAAIAPAALSLIGDLFPRERRALAVGVFAFGVSIGSSAAFILGGLLIKTYQAAGAIMLPGLGVAEPWRLVFLTVGASGLVLAPLALLIHEPPRRDAVKATLAAPIAFVRRNGRLIAGHFIGFGVFSTLSTAFGAWAPSVLIREHGLSPASVGAVFGLIVLGAGLTGTLLGGATAGWLVRRGRMDASLLTALLGLTAALAPAMMAPLASNPAVCLSLFAATFLCVAFASGASLAAVQDATPSPLRGQISALYYLVMNLFGLTLGPLLVPLTASVLPGKGGHLSLALSLTSGAVIVIGLALIAWVRPLFAAAVALRRDDDLT